MRHSAPRGSTWSRARCGTGCGRRSCGSSSAPPMPAFENLFLVILVALLAGTALVLVLGLMRGRGGEARQLYAAAVAARHRLDFARAEGPVAQLPPADPRDRAAWV